MLLGDNNPRGMVDEGRHDFRDHHIHYNDD